MNPAEIVWVALLQAEADGDSATADKLRAMLGDPAALQATLSRLQPAK